MKINYVEKQSQEIQYVPEKDDAAYNMKPKDVEHIAEIFNTPLVGTYNWDYIEVEDRLQRLYELGKKLNWNTSTDLDWDDTILKSESPYVLDKNPYGKYEQYQDMSKEDQAAFDWYRLADTVNQFLHGEQGALLVASQLVSCAPTYNAKLYASSQTFDEARHVEFFNQFKHKNNLPDFPCNEGLKTLLDMLLTDERWDLKLFGMQVMIEGLALAAFNTHRASTTVPVFKKGLTLVARDEGRHNAFGVAFLNDFTKTLTTEEKDDRAFIALECLRLLRNPDQDKGVFKKFGWDGEHASEYLRNNFARHDFKIQLFGRIIPNLKEIGLLESKKVRDVFGEIGLLDFEGQDSDGKVDWNAMEKPLSDLDAADYTVNVSDQLREQMIATSLRRRKEKEEAAALQ